MTKGRASLIAASLVAVAVGLTGCAGASGASSSPGSTAGPSAPRIDHVHGIAQDPRGDDLLVATHTGIFTVTASGEVSGPVGGHVFDAMGFTVAGDVLFAKWHPWKDVTVETWLLPASPWHIRVHRITSPRELHATEGGFAVALMLKDLKLAVEAAQDAGASTPMGAAAQSLYQLFANAGANAVDFSAVIKLLDGSWNLEPANT